MGGPSHVPPRAARHACQTQFRGRVWKEYAGTGAGRVSTCGPVQGTAAHVGGGRHGGAVPPQPRAGAGPPLRRAAPGGRLLPPHPCRAPSVIPLPPGAAAAERRARALARPRRLPLTASRPPVRAQHEPGTDVSCALDGAAGALTWLHGSMPMSSTQPARLSCCGADTFKLSCPLRQPAS